MLILSQRTLASYNSLSASSSLQTTRTRDSENSQTRPTTHYLELLAPPIRYWRRRWRILRRLRTRLPKADERNPLPVDPV